MAQCHLQEREFDDALAIGKEFLFGIGHSTLLLLLLAVDVHLMRSRTKAGVSNDCARVNAVAIWRKRPRLPGQAGSQPQRLRLLGVCHASNVTAATMSSGPTDLEGNPSSRYLNLTESGPLPARHYVLLVSGSMNPPHRGHALLGLHAAEKLRETGHKVTVLQTRARRVVCRRCPSF
eukprot:6451226-Amphidinium_carterae.1